MKLTIWKYFSKILLRIFHQFHGLSLSYSRPGQFEAIPSICNQRSLDYLTYWLRGCSFFFVLMM